MASVPVEAMADVDKPSAPVDASTKDPPRKQYTTRSGRKVKRKPILDAEYDTPSVMDAPPPPPLAASGSFAGSTPDTAMTTPTNFKRSRTTKRASRPRSSKGDGSTGRRRRTYAKRACGWCRKLKEACDNQRPCTRCVKRKRAHLCCDVPTQVQRRQQQSAGANKRRKANPVSAPPYAPYQPTAGLDSLYPSQLALASLSNPTARHAAGMGSLDMDAVQAMLNANSSLPLMLPTTDHSLGQGQHMQMAQQDQLMQLLRQQQQQQQLQFLQLQAQNMAAHPWDLSSQYMLMSNPAAAAAGSLGSLPLQNSPLMMSASSLNAASSAAQQSQASTTPQLQQRAKQPQQSLSQQQLLQQLQMQQQQQQQQQQKLQQQQLHQQQFQQLQQQLQMQLQQEQAQARKQQQNPNRVQTQPAQLSVKAETGSMANVASQLPTQRQQRQQQKQQQQRQQQQKQKQQTQHKPMQQPRSTGQVKSQPKQKQQQPQQAALQGMSADKLVQLGMSGSLPPSLFSVGGGLDPALMSMWNPYMSNAALLGGVPGAGTAGSMAATSYAMPGVQYAAQGQQQQQRQRQQSELELLSAALAPQSSPNAAGTAAALAQLTAGVRGVSAASKQPSTTSNGLTSAKNTNGMTSHSILTAQPTASRAATTAFASIDPTGPSAPTTLPTPADIVRATWPKSATPAANELATQAPKAMTKPVLAGVSDGALLGSTMAHSTTSGWKVTVDPPPSTSGPPAATAGNASALSSATNAVLAKAGVSAASAPSLAKREVTANGSNRSVSA